MTSFFEFFQSNGNLLILNLILQITLLSGIAIILAYRYKNNAATRYGILFPAFISLLLLTATSVFLQSRNASLFYLPVNIEQTPSTAAAQFIFDELAIPGFESESVSTGPAALGVAQKSIAVEESTNTAWQILLGLPPYLILMGIWVGGFLILTMGLLRSFHNLEQVSRRSTQLSVREKRRLDKLVVNVLSKKARVPFRVSDQISSPMLTGLISPVILLPDNFIANLNERQLMSVLLHELAHFERNDLLANFLQKVIFTVFWFHPLIHVMDRMIARAREEICDNYVLANEQPLDYSEALLHVSTLTSKCEFEAAASGLAVGMFGSEWKLEQRIGELLNENRERSMKLSRRTGRALQCFLMSLSLLLAACQLGVVENGDALADADEQAAAAQELSSNQQDVQRQLKRGARQLIDRTAQLKQQKEMLAEQSLITQEQASQLGSRIRQLEEEIQQLATRSRNNAAPEQLALLQGEAANLQNVQAQLERKLLQLRDQGESLQQQKRNLAEQDAATDEQIRLLRSDARELELEIRAMADRKENMLRRQQQLQREMRGPNPAVTKEELLGSLGEIRILLQEDGDREQHEDIARLTRGMLEDFLRQVSRLEEGELFEPQFVSGVEAIWRYLDDGPFDEDTFLRVLDALLVQSSPQGAPQNGAAVYIQAQATTQPPPQSQSRPAPIARTVGTLGPRISEAINQIQEYMRPEDKAVDADMNAAKALLDQLYSERFERMNDFEKSTTLSFYTNYYLGTENYPEAIRSFEQTLTIETLRNDIRLRTLRSLGQLYAALENWEESIQYYQLWREASQQEDEVTYRGLSYAYYQLEQFDDALPNWLSYMELVKENNGELDREDYSYLNGLYFTLKDFDSALELTKEMILLFNEPIDWRNLRAIFTELDDLQETTEIEEELTGALKEFRTDSQITEQIVRVSDADYLPLIANAPLYPTRAAQRGIEGWILLAFTVDEQGNVADDSVKVIDADPPNVFNRSAIRAAVKFKYEPRVRDGSAVAVPGVQYLFRYELNENV